MLSKLYHQSQAEPDTDEVYAQITLIPELDVSSLPLFAPFSLFNSIMTYSWCWKQYLVSRISCWNYFEWAAYISFYTFAALTYVFLHYGPAKWGYEPRWSASRTWKVHSPFILQDSYCFWHEHPWWILSFAPACGWLSAPAGQLKRIDYISFILNLRYSIKLEFFWNFYAVLVPGHDTAATMAGTDFNWSAWKWVAFSAYFSRLNIIAFFPDVFIGCLSESWKLSII